MKNAVSRFASIGLISVAAVLAAAPIAAQITINLPKFPKIKKEKPQPTTTTTTETSTRPASSTTTSPTASEAPPPKKGCADDPVLNHHLGEVAKTRAEAEEFTPGSRNYFVSTLSDRKNVYLEAALLKNSRADFLGKWPAELVNCMTPALDGLAAAARKTLPGFTGPAGYTFGTPVERKTLANTVSDVSQAKVLRSGLKQAGWLIDKNDFGLPTARYKHGYVLLQYPGMEFCWVYLINLVQDYAGGGTYGDSYGSYVGRSFAGCPKA